MPHYTFRCEECGIVFERYYSFQESLEGIQCPQGHARVVRLYRPPAIVFKGSGFYVTDHGRNNGNGQGPKSSEKQVTPSEEKTVKGEAKAQATPQAA